MDSTSNIRALPGWRITASDIERELNPTGEQLVEIAMRDVGDDLDLMGYAVDQVPERHYRRLVLLRAQWRRCMGGAIGPAMALADDYSRLLDDLDLYMATLPVAKPRRRKAR